MNTLPTGATSFSQARYALACDLAEDWDSATLGYFLAVSKKVRFGHNVALAQNAPILLLVSTAISRPKSRIR